MGVVTGIGYQTFPKQGNHLGKRVNVCFEYDTTHVISGKVVRDDMSEPFELIICLDDGRYIRSVECQYSVEL